MTALGDAAARGTGITLVTQAARAVLQFGSVVVLARLLAPEDFGLIAMVTSVIGIAELVRDFGLSSAAVQVKTLSDDERTNLFWVNLGLGAVCALAAVVAQPLIVALYDEPRLGAIVLSLSAIFVLSGASTQFRADLTRSLRFRALGTSDVVAQQCGVTTAVALAVQGQGLWAIVAQQLVVAAVALVTVVSAAGWRPGWPRRGTSITRFFRFGGGLFGTQAIHYATKNVDNVALGAVAGAAALGLYTRAYQLLMTPLSLINAPMTRVALPVLSRVQDDENTYARYLRKVQLVGCYLTATVFTVAAGLAEPLVQVLFGRRWLEVAPIFAALALGGVFRSLSQVAYWIYLSKGVPGAQLRLSLVTGPLIVLVMLAGLPWGALGVAVGHSVAHALYWLVSLVHVGRVTGVDTRHLLVNAVRSVLLVSAPCGVAAWLGGLVPLPPLAQVLVGAALAAVYLLAARTLVPTVRRDADTVLSFARRALRR